MRTSGVVQSLAMAVMVLVVVACAGNRPAGRTPRLATGANAEITHDGLHRVEKSAMDAAWIKPDLDLGRYAKLMVVSDGISFSPVDSSGKRWWPSPGSGTRFPISREGKARLADEMQDAFVAELSRLERYELVNEPGEGVLLMVVSLIDVVSRVPPADACPGNCDIYLTELGEATLVVELRESVSDEILARAVDHRVARAFGMTDVSTTVTVWPEVRRVARSWARLVRTRLDQLATVAGGQ